MTRWRHQPPSLAAMTDPLDLPLTEVVDVRCPALLPSLDNPHGYAALVDERLEEEVTL
jgi:hypothetical protein